VDDEPAIRNTVRRALERQGYQVLQAQDGIDALAQFTSRRYEIKAVVTDVMMPQMDGVMLSRTLRHLSPQTPIIVSTGGLLARNSDDFIQTLDTLGIRHILHKPHSAEALLQALDEVLHPADLTPPNALRGV
jgi:CheY-like chemotaxis protein